MVGLITALLSLWLSPITDVSILLAGMPIEAVTDRPAIDTTVLEVVSDGVGIIVVFSAPEDGFDCETLVGFMVCDVVGDALDDVALFI